MSDTILGYEKGEALEGEVERLTAAWSAQYDEINQLRTALANMTEVARLAQEATATAETRAATRCAEVVRTWNYNGSFLQASEAIKKEFGL